MSISLNQTDSKGSIITTTLIAFRGDFLRLNSFIEFQRARLQRFSITHLV